MRRILIASALLLAAAACSDGAAPSAPLALEPCFPAAAPGAESGSVVVEEGQEVPPAAPPGLFFHCGTLGEGETAIEVAVVSDRAEGPLAGRRVLVYHPGGPGISPVETLLGDPPGVDYAIHSVLAWDGVTASRQPGACGPLAGLYASADRAAELEIAGDVAVECLGGGDTAAPAGAPAAAAELEAVRQALGVERVDLLTHSYGTAVAEAYLHAHSDRVARAVLDGPVALEVGWDDRLAAVGDALDRVTVPLAGAYIDLRSGLMAAPAPVGSSTLELTGTTVDQATLLAMRSQEYWPGYQAAVAAAAAGDATSLWQMSERYYFGLDRSVFYAALCSDIDHPRSFDGYRVDDHPLLAAYASELAPCAAIARGGLGAPGDAGRPEVLVLASPFDVLTPAALLDSAPVLRERGTVCRTDVVGHTSFADPAVGPMVLAFLATGAAPGC